MNKSESSSVLSLLANEQLSAVTFVQDYVQFDFDGMRLSAYAWPQILNHEGSITLNIPGYRDALCGRIGKKVLRAIEKPEEKLIIEFVDGVILEISLDESDREGPEAAMLQDRLHRNWNVW